MLNGTGYHEIEFKNGDLHQTRYERGYNIRYSRDLGPDNVCRNRHIVDQDDGQIVELEDCTADKDDYF